MTFHVISNLLNYYLRINKITEMKSEGIININNPITVYIHTCHSKNFERKQKKINTFLFLSVSQLALYIHTGMYGRRLFYPNPNM